MRGYTPDTAHIETADYREFARMCRDFGQDVAMVMEGRIYAPEDAMKALYLGAQAVVVGSAITRPHLITKRFTDRFGGELRGPRGTGAAHRARPGKATGKCGWGVGQGVGAFRTRRDALLRSTLLTSRRQRSQTELDEIARRAGVPNRSRMTQAQLQAEVFEWEQQRRRAGRQGRANDRE